jgi:hypothetical protein
MAYSMTWPSSYFHASKAGEEPLLQMVMINVDKDKEPINEDMKSQVSECPAFEE